MNVQVAILGGGLSGLAAAHKLVKAGVTDIAVLEAKDRVGGRVHTVKYGSGPLEMGAQWIHGEEGNVLCDLAKKKGYLYKFREDQIRKQFWLDFDGDDDDAESGFFLSDGSQVPMKLIKKVISKFNKHLTEAENHFREKSLEKREQFRKLLFKETRSVLDLFHEDDDLHIMENGLEAACEHLNENQNGALDRDDISVAAYVVRHLVECLKSAEDWQTEQVMLGLLDWRLCVEKVENSCTSLEEIPVSVWGEYYQCPGEEGVELGSEGYQPIVSFFSEGIPTSSIKLNSVVERVVWEGSKSEKYFCNLDISDGSHEENHIVTEIVNGLNVNETNICSRRVLTKGENDDKIVIKLKSGEIYRADYVLVTLPLGVLKYHCLPTTANCFKPENLFSPPLPRPKLEAIEKLAYGTVDKIYLEFENPFWDWENSELGFQLIWQRGENLELDCLKKWGRCYEDTKWYRAIQGFNTMLQHRNLLCGWIGGRDAEEMENEQEEFVIDICVELLARFSGKGKSGLPRPKKMIRTNWSQDPFSRGSYSYRSFGSSLESSLELARPLPSEEDPRLLFAGEATHSIFYSTTHGAVLTGVKQANKILCDMKQKQEIPSENDNSYRTKL